MHYQPIVTERMDEFDFSFVRGNDQ